MIDDEFNLPQVLDNIGFMRRLGTLIAPQTTANMPLYETAQKMLSWAEIEDVARSGKMDGKKRFPGKSWIKNQRSHGSCNGFAEAMAGARARFARGLERVDLSGAYAYSLMNGGRDNGSSLADGRINVAKMGVCSEALVGWDQIYRSSYDTAKADAEAARFKAPDGEVFAVATKQGWYSGLAQGFIAVGAVHVARAFMNVNSAGVAGVDNGPGNHSIGVEGLIWDGGLVETAWNHWDVTYGVEGRMNLLWDHHEQTFKYHEHYLFRAMIDDPQGDNPPILK